MIPQRDGGKRAQRFAVGAGGKLRAVEKLHYTKRDDASQTLNTDWVEWNRLDEDQPYRGRYQISVKQQGYQQAVIVKLVNLEQAGKPVCRSGFAAALQYRHAERHLRRSGSERHQRAERRAKTGGDLFDVQSGADHTGLPMLIVRAALHLVWQRLPGALEKVGMKVTDSSRSQGSFSVTYKPLSDSGWNQLGARDPGSWFPAIINCRSGTSITAAVCSSSTRKATR
ncbi:outer membrane protein assembly factor BamC [Escherichia coli]